mmetsp:Transcript_29747/g.77915  ORF Transcript_29747/g.77915 Transcript_29747/m.77915 type:complete len:308 (-) Transcript_29747:836-1759(-)
MRQASTSAGRQRHGAPLAARRRQGWQPSRAWRLAQGVDEAVEGVRERLVAGRFHRALAVSARQLHEHEVDLRGLALHLLLELPLLLKPLHPALHLGLPPLHELGVLPLLKRVAEERGPQRSQDHRGPCRHGGLALGRPESGQLSNHGALLQHSDEGPLAPHLHLALGQPVDEVVAAGWGALLDEGRARVQLLGLHAVAQLLEQVQPRPLEDGVGREEVRVGARDGAPEAQRAARQPRGGFRQVHRHNCAGRADRLVQRDQPVARVLQQLDAGLGVLCEDRDHHLPAEDYAMTLRRCRDVRGPSLQQV